jgi:hypothetical protein
VDEALVKMEGVADGAGMIVLELDKVEFREPPESGGSVWRGRSVCEL